MSYKNKTQKQSAEYSTLKVSLSSPEDILAKSSGEVTKPETINYRTYKPERDGLFCERIFGPTKDFECHCGKYKRIRYRGIVCDRCGVEVTEKKVRRERVGHINLVVPVAHIWYFRTLPNKIGYLLGLPSKKMDQIIYYERYVVIQTVDGAVNEEGEPLENNDFITEEEYLNIYSNAIVYGLEEAIEGPYKKAGLDIKNIENWPVEKINWVPQELKGNVGRSLTDRFSNFKNNLENNSS